MVGGAWPILSLRSFEWVYGQKRDVYLQKTVGGLLVAVGYAQLTAADSDDGLAVARRLGIAAAATLLAIDLIYIPRGEMRKTYIQDALSEIGWLAAWLKLPK